MYNNIRESVILANNVNLVVVSIGLPEVGTKLADHLDLDKGDEWIFCDPENALYDALGLNGGITNFMTAGKFTSFVTKLVQGMNMLLIIKILPSLYFTTNRYCLYIS